jgi:hypothetical protein
MYKYLFISHFLVFISIGARNLGVSITATKLRLLIPANKSEIADNLADNLQTDFLWTFIINFTIIDYLLSLLLMTNFTKVYHIKILTYGKSLA